MAVHPASPAPTRRVRTLTSQASAANRRRPARRSTTLDVLLGGVRMLGENQLNAVPFSRDADRWSADAGDGSFGPWRRRNDPTPRRTRRLVTALPGTSTSPSQSAGESRPPAVTSTRGGTRRAARRSSTATLAAVEFAPARRNWRMRSLILSVTVATSGAAIAAASALTRSPDHARANGVPPALSTPKCGARSGEIPCNWWRGVNVYSGFYDQFGPGRSLGQGATTAIGTVAAYGANQYLVYVSTLDVRSDNSVVIGARAISDDHLIQAASYAGRLGAVPVLKPHIPNPTAVIPAGGFVDSYSRVLERYGRIATQMRAKVFVIATELTQVYRDPEAMNALIDAASRSYHVAGGELAVAINWDQLQEALTFPWLARVRLIGVDGYWPVGPARGTTAVARIEDHWNQPTAQTDGSFESPGQAVAQLGAAGHQVVFTEIGYNRCRGAAADPSGQPDAADSSSCGPVATSPGDQQAATQAAYCYWTSWSRAHGDPGWFHGLWWWDIDLSKAPNIWDLRGGAGGAMGIVRSWNTGKGARCPGGQS
jgi:hypothetical protein